MRRLLDAAAAVAMIVASGFMIWSAMREPSSPPPSEPPKRQEVALPKEPIAIEGAAFLGRADAPIVAMEFSDFQCPYCGTFSREVVPSLIKEYVDTGKVALVFRHFPLDSIHPYAEQAAQAANCAGRRQLFWRFHDRIFTERTAFTASTISAALQSIGADGPEFRTCLASDETKNEVARDVKAGRALGVSGTPTLLIGSRVNDAQFKVRVRISGGRSIEGLREVLNALLGENQSK